MRAPQKRTKSLWVWGLSALTRAGAASPDRPPLRLREAATTNERPDEGRWFLDTWMKVLCDADSTGGAMAVIDWHGEGAENASLLVTTLPAGIVIGFVIGPLRTNGVRVAVRSG